MSLKKNYLTTNYQKDRILKIKHNYLTEQFFDYKKILKSFEKVINWGKQKEI